MSVEEPANDFEPATPACAGPATPAAAEPPRTPPPRAVRRAPSLVLVATGEGKGKTTAAMGTVLRSLGRGWQVCVVQFVKSGSWHGGDVKVLQSLGTSWHTIGDGFSWTSKDLEASAELAREAWRTARQAIESARYHLVVLDEVTYPLNWGWLDVAEVETTIRQRPAKVNIFLTGRDAPAWLVELADTVTEMRNLKHAFEAGIRAAKGIDF